MRKKGGGGEEPRAALALVSLENECGLEGRLSFRLNE